MDVKKAYEALNTGNIFTEISNIKDILEHSAKDGDTSSVEANNCRQRLEAVAQQVSEAIEALK